MKKITIITIILLSTFFLKAQQCKDVIYPTKGESIIFNCCIDEVKYGNMVRYTKNDSTSFIEAITIVKDGITLELKPNKAVSSSQENNGLYKGHDYNFYQQEYKQAKKLRTTGIIIASVGLFGGAALGTILAVTDNPLGAQVSFFVGTIVLGTGTAILLVGAGKANNAKKAMDAAKNQSNLSLGLSNNGIGLIFTF